MEFEAKESEWTEAGKKKTQQHGSQEEQMKHA